MTKLFLGFWIIIGLVTVTSFSIKSNMDHAAITSNEEGNVKWMTWVEAVNQLEADKKNGKKAKKIFVDVYTDWCGWCKKMDKETFEEPHIAAYLNKHFYPVKFNAEQRADISFNNHLFKFVQNGNRGYHELAVALLDGKMSYPTVVFLTEELELFQRIPGYLNVDTFDAILHYLAENHYSTTPWETFQQEWAAKKHAGSILSPMKGN